MEFQFQFLHVDVSQTLTEYAEDHFRKVGKPLVNESHWHVTFKSGRYDCKVTVAVNSSWGHFQAEAIGESFYHAVDACAEKLGRQLSKEKQKLQRHRKHDRTKHARLNRLNAALEYDNSPFPYKKSV